MKKILFISFFLSLSAKASIVGITTHPLDDEARLLSAEMTGYMSNRNEMGAGLRYTQEVARGRILDITASGGQDSRGLTTGAGMDFEILREDVSQPRISIKPYAQFQKLEDQSSHLMGAAPTIRKGISINGQEIFPYLAIPSGLKISSDTNDFVYYASMTVGASMALNNKVLLSFEGNKNMGASSDYVGCLVSWIWK
jgi:hypothetical protein